MAVALVLSCLICCTLLWHLGVRYAAHAEKQWSAEHDLAVRRVKIDEQRLAMDVEKGKPRAKSPPMPADLRNRIASYEEDWAQEAEERTIQVLYAEYDDWDLVRKNLRPLNSITDPASLDTPYVEEFPR